MGKQRKGSPWKFTELSKLKRELPSDNGKIREPKFQRFYSR